MGKAEAQEVEGRRLDGLDGLRALAALSVFVGHVFTLSVLDQAIEFQGAKNRLLTGGGMGVFVFFSLSGYLLYRPFVRALEDPERRVRLLDYARNRALRILPLYLTVVAVVFLFIPFDIDRSQWWRYVLFIHNYWSGSGEFADSPIWSLQVEMQFYILLPLLAWLLAVLSRGRRRRLAIMLIVLAWFSYALRRNAINDHDALGIWGKFSLPTLMYLFVSGMLVAVLDASMRARSRRWAQWPVIGSSNAWIVVGVLSFLLITTNYGLQEPTIAFGGFLLVGGVALPLRRGVLWDVLRLKPLVAIGIASYSLYLWHVPIIETITGIHGTIRDGKLITVGGTEDFKLLLIEAAVIVAPVTYLSYRFIEVPFLARRKRWASPQPEEPRGPQVSATPAPAEPAMR